MRDQIVASQHALNNIVMSHGSKIRTSILKSPNKFTLKGGIEKLNEIRLSKGKAHKIGTKIETEIGTEIRTEIGTEISSRELTRAHAS